MIPILTNTPPPSLSPQPITLTVTQHPDKRWAVITDTGVVVGTFNTNARAWRAADRLANEPLNKREDTAVWAWRQSLAVRRPAGGLT